MLTLDRSFSILYPAVVLFAFVFGRRYHVPLVTHPLVTMRWPEDGEEHHLEAGWLYEVDYTRLHEIIHRAPVDRVHVQVNVWPSA